MKTRVTYRVNPDKAIEALVWLAEQQPNIDIYHISKVLYYAEKEHINKYGRPIIGDTYISMPWGQVPSWVKDVIDGNTWTVDPEFLKKFRKALEVNKKPHKNLSPNRKPNIKYLSKTDIECLKESLKKYGKMSFSKLKKISHDEITWIETERNEPIDYALMIDDDNPNKKEILEEMRSNATYARF